MNKRREFITLLGGADLMYAGYPYDPFLPPAAHRPRRPARRCADPPASHQVWPRLAGINRAVSDADVGETRRS
jgi:hypothetical protein